MHIGDSLVSGHYIAFVKGRRLVGDQPPAWFKMDDSTATEVGLAQFTVRVY